MKHYCSHIITITSSKHQQHHVCFIIIWHKGHQLSQLVSSFAGLYITFNNWFVWHFQQNHIIRCSVTSYILLTVIYFKVSVQSLPSFTAVIIKSHENVKKKTTENCLKIYCNARHSLTIVHWVNKNNNIDHDTHVTWRTNTKNAVTNNSHLYVNFNFKLLNLLIFNNYNLTKHETSLTPFLYASRTVLMSLPCCSSIWPFISHSCSHKTLVVSGHRRTITVCKWAAFNVLLNTQQTTSETSLVSDIDVFVLKKGR